MIDNLRKELLVKLRKSHASLATLEGDEHTHEASHFAELSDTVRRMDVIAEQERMTASRAETGDRELWGVFGKLLRGEPVDDVARGALAIREMSLLDSAGPTAFRIPGDALDWIQQLGLLSATVRRSTTTTAEPPLGSVSADIGNVIGGEAQANLMTLPLPPTPWFDASTKLPAINGVAIPFIAQTAANPYGGITITRPTDEGTDKPESGIPDDDKETIATQEYSGSTIISDLALRRAPQYDAAIGTMLRGAIAGAINDDIIAAILADAGVIVVPRQVLNQVAWADLINLEGSVPWYWNVAAKYAMHQDVQTYLKSTLTAAPGYPMYNVTTAAAMYTSLNGRPFFLDAMAALGVEGDVVYGDPRNVFLGVGQDIVFKRTSEGLQLTQANSTLFVVFAHMGIGVPIPAAFARLDNAVATTTTS